MSLTIRRRAAAAALSALLGTTLVSCTAATPEGSDPAAATTTQPLASVDVSSFDLSGLSELGYVHNENLMSPSLVQWQAPGCTVQALVAPTFGSGDDAADSVRAFDSLGPEFTDLTEGGWVRLPLGQGGTLLMSVRRGTVTLEGSSMPIDVATRSVGEVGTLFVITHSCEPDAVNPTDLDGVIQRIILNNVLNPDA